MSKKWTLDKSDLASILRHAILPAAGYGITEALGKLDVTKIFTDPTIQALASVGIAAAIRFVTRLTSGPDAASSPAA
jgi:hypothetical protein